MREGSWTSGGESREEDSKETGGQQQMELVDQQQKRCWNHFYPLWEAGSIILKNNEWHSLRPVPSAIDVWKPRDPVSEKILITHHCPINRSSWVEAGDEKPESPGLEAIQLDRQALRQSLMATAQALMSMNLIISRWVGEMHIFKNHCNFSDSTIHVDSLSVNGISINCLM